MPMSSVFIVQKNSLMHLASAITVAATAIFHYYKEMLVSAVIIFYCMINITQVLSSCGHPRGGESKNGNTIVICQNHSTGKNIKYLVKNHCLNGMVLIGVKY